MSATDGAPSRRPARRARGMVVMAVAVACVAQGSDAGAEGAAPPAAPAQGWSIPAGREQQILELIAPYRLGGAVAGGYSVAGAQVGASEVLFQLRGGAADVPVDVTVRLDGDAATGKAPRSSVVVQPSESALSGGARDAATVLAQRIAEHATDAFWLRVLRSQAEMNAAGAEEPAPWPAALALASLLALAVLVEIAWRRRDAAARRSSDVTWDALRAAVWALVVAVPIIVWFYATPFREAEEHERRFVALSLGAAAVALALALAAAVVWTVRAARESDDDTPDHGWPLTPRRALAYALDAGVVLAWSLVVRFAFTAPNILTDGGTGYGRLLHYTQRFGGLAVLVDWLVPRALHGAMWPSLEVPRLLAALTPPLLVLYARSLGVERRASFLAGLALASYPLHAALYASDFEAGVIPTLQLLGLILLLGARATRRALLAVAGLAVLAYALWIRPEAVLAVGLPLVVLAATSLRRAPRDLWLRPPVAAALAGIVTVALVYLATLHAAPTAPRGARLFGIWKDFPFRAVLGSSIVLPLWLWLPAPLGFSRRGPLSTEARWLAAAGLVAGFLPAHFGTPADPFTRSYVEVFRYGTPALPHLALLAAAGVVLVADLVGLWLARRRTGAPVVGGPRPRATRVLIGVVAGAMVATPLVHRDYLARRYGHAVEEAAFLAALARVPDACGLVVPEEEARPDGGTHQIADRYRSIAAEQHARDPRSLPPSHVVASDAFLRAAEAQQRLPRYAELPRSGDTRVARAPDDKDGPSCWYWFRGAYCAHGGGGHPPATCTRLDARTVSAPVARWVIDYRFHRLVSAPDDTRAPWYSPRLELRLVELLRFAP